MGEQRGENAGVAELEVAVVPDIDVKVFHLGRTLVSRGSREINRIKSLPTGTVSSRFPASAPPV